MAYCGKCGAQIESGEFCPQCGTPQNMNMNQTRNVGKHLKTTGVLMKVLLAVCLLAALSFGIHNITSVSKQPCDWCGNSPSTVYKTSDGGKAYVCKECRKKCAICGERATKHYENALGMMVFVCRDCYEDVVGE